MSRNERPVLIYTTVETVDAAGKVGRELVQSRLAACVNIIPATTAIYRWDGALQEATEAIMIIKTSSRRLDDALERTKSLHPYETPALLVINPKTVDADFAAWISDQTLED